MNRLVDVNFFAHPDVSEHDIPHIGAGVILRDIVGEIKTAGKNQYAPIVWGIGGHVIKTGLSQWIIKMMRTGFCTHVALNGAAAIHDIEIALSGSTSEDVDMGLRLGTYASDQTSAKALGEIEDGEFDWNYAPYREYSVLFAAGENYSIHPAAGVEYTFLHQVTGDAKPMVKDGGEQHFVKFRDVARKMMMNGGVYINCGCAVILPECFLKAMAWTRIKDKEEWDACNIDHSSLPYSFTCINLDMQRQYRTTQQVVNRPRILGARTYELLGMHEINIPLICKMVLDGENLDKEDTNGNDV